MTRAIDVQAVRVLRDGTAVLSDLSLVIESGERVGLVGRNGAGKTTLLQTLFGLHPTAAGSVHVAGLNTQRPGELARIRRVAGMVFQRADDQLFAGTVEDDVAFGPLNLGLSGDAARAAVDRALAAVGAAHLRQRVSHHLSAGEKRRVAIATALAMDPRLLVLDEPTSELDPVGRRTVVALLASLDQTLLIASHDLEFIRETCGRVVVLSDGAVAADAVTDEVLADAALMERAGLEVPYSLRSEPTQPRRRPQ